jgi:hypothetical protein
MDSPNSSHDSADATYEHYSSGDNSKPNPKLNSSNWDQSNIDRLVMTYNSYIECADYVGVFSPEVFQKWKQLLIKQDEGKKQELREIFKQIDVRKRGIISREGIL